MIDLDLKNAWDDATHDENVFCPVRRTRASGNDCFNFFSIVLLRYNSEGWIF